MSGSDVKNVLKREEYCLLLRKYVFGGTVITICIWNRDASNKSSSGLKFICFRLKKLRSLSKRNILSALAEVCVWRMVIGIRIWNRDASNKSNSGLKFICFCLKKLSSRVAVTAASVKTRIAWNDCQWLAPDFDISDMRGLRSKAECGDTLFAWGRMRETSNFRTVGTHKILNILFNNLFCEYLCCLWEVIHYVSYIVIIW